MKQIDIGLYFVVLLLSLNSLVLSHTRLLIDVESDIPNDGTWDIDCEDGYQDLSTDFVCEEHGGGIEIPPDKLNGEIGFWTRCHYTCRIKYHIQPNDVKLKLRMYQSGLQTEVIKDDSTDFIPGEGWIEFELSLVNGHELTIGLDHFSPDLFIALDKIVINGDFDPTQPPTGTTDAEASSTTDITTEMTETTTEDVTSDIPSSTTEDDMTSTTSDDTTTLSSTTTDDLSSTVSDDPTDASSDYPSTSELPTSSTDDPSTETDSSTSSETDTTTEITETTTEDATNSPTSDITGSTTDDDSTSSTSDDTTTFSTTDDNGLSSISSQSPTSSGDPSSTSSTDDPSNTSPISDTTELTTEPTTTDDSTTNSGPVISTTFQTSQPGTPPNPCTNPPCPSTSPFTTSTTTEKSSDSSFVTSIWGAFTFSVLGLSLFVLVLICVLRCCYVRTGGPRGRTWKDDEQDIISQRDSSSTHGSHTRTDRDDRELYLYMDHYPQLSNSLNYSKSSPPPLMPLPLPSSVPPPLPEIDPLSPRAIYRESTPYMVFQPTNEVIGYSPEVMYESPPNEHFSPAPTPYLNQFAPINANNSVQVLPRYPQSRQAPPIIPQQQHPENFHTSYQPHHRRGNQNNQQHEYPNRVSWVVP